MKAYPHGGMLCLLGPYGDFFIDVLAEILEKFPDVDAFSFDGLHYGGVCYCKNCRENYRKETGAEIPAADLNHPDFRRYQHWADRKMEDLVRRMQARLKGIKPDVALNDRAQFCDGTAVRRRESHVKSHGFVGRGSGERAP